MEKRIELEKRRLSAAEVTELNLDNCRSTMIEGLTPEFVNLKSLSLIGVGLTSLKGLPKLPKLEKLELSENRISGGLQALCILTSLKTLNLSNNKLAESDLLQPLSSISTLKSLEVQGNDLAGEADYFQKILAMLPGIKYLDGVGRYEKNSDSDSDDAEAKLNGKDINSDDEDDFSKANARYNWFDLDWETGAEPSDIEDDEVTTGKVGAGNQEASTDESDDGLEDKDDDEEDDDSESGSDFDTNDTTGYGNNTHNPLSDLYSDVKTLESGSDYEADDAETSDDEVSDDEASEGQEAPIIADGSKNQGAETQRGVKRPHEGDESS